MDTQRCPRCGEYKGEDGYQAASWGTLGRMCRDCRRAYSAQWRRDHGAVERPKRVPGLQRCTACGEDKGPDGFRPSRWGYGRGGPCRSCLNERLRLERRARGVPERRPAHAPRSADVDCDMCFSRHSWDGAHV